MYSKVFNVQNQVVLACCDKELIGKTIEQGEVCMEVREEFYKGKITSVKELAKMLGEADNINLLGKKAVGVALKEGFIIEKDIIKVRDVPHVQIFRL